MVLERELSRKSWNVCYLCWSDVFQEEEDKVIMKESYLFTYNIDYIDS